MLTPHRNQELPALQKKLLNLVYALALGSPLVLLLVRFALNWRLPGVLALTLMALFPLLGMAIALSSPLSLSERLKLGSKHAFILIFLPALNLLFM